MPKYLNVFNTLAEYQAFSASTEYVQPNVALVKETNVLYYDYGNNKPQPNYTDYKVSSRSLVSDGGDTYGLNETLCLNYIPSGVTDMSYTFRGCSSLKEVTFLHTTPPRYYNTLSSCSKLETIYVLDSAVSAYKTATGWSQFASKIKPLSEKAK